MATKPKVSANTGEVSVSPLMTFKEAALYLHCGVKSIRRLCATGVLAYRDDLGKGFLLRRDEVERFLERGWHRALEPESRPVVSKRRVKAAKSGRNRLILKGGNKTVAIETNAPAVGTGAGA